MSLSRKRRLIMAAASTAGIVGITVPVTMALAEETEPASSAQTECEVNVLPGPDGNESGKVRAVSQNGEWMGGTADGTSVVWHGDEYQELHGKVVDVNSSGVAVGYDTDDSGVRHGWVWQDGEYIAELSSPNDYGGVAPVGINDEGQIAGNTGDLEGGEYLSLEPVFWDSPDADATPLELKEDATGEVFDITEEGSSLGRQAAEDAPWATVWEPDGSSSDLPETETDENGYSAVPKRGNGSFVLSTLGGAEADTHYLWDTGADPTAQALYRAKDVDSNGQVYGRHIADGQALPAFAKGDDVTLLAALNEKAGKDADNTAWAASGDGSVIAGTAVSQDDTGVTRAVTWKCG